MAARTRWNKILGWTSAIVFAVASVVGSEVYCLESNKPKDVRDINGYVKRFGEPESARVLRRDDKIYYELTGHLPKWYVFAHPSSPPAYIFDDNGKFVEWCYDPGDVSSYYERWPRPRGIDDRMDFAEVHGF